MKRTLLSLFVLVSMLLGLVASAAAAPSFAMPVAAQASQQAPDQVVAKVYFTSRDQLSQLSARYDILSVDQKLGIAYVLLSTPELAALQQAGFTVEIDQAKTKLITQANTPLPGQGTDSIPGYPCYRTVQETYATLHEIAAAHPDLAVLYDIGDSWLKTQGQGGYDIYALRLSNINVGYPDPKPTFFVMAEIHAREYATSELATRYAEYLVNNYGTDPDITWLLDYFQVYIVTMANPDGRIIAEGGDLWRKNVDSDDGCNDPWSWGTDLNRNYGFHWEGGGSSPYPCDETYRGPSANSEPETITIENLVTSIFTDQRGPGDTDPAPLDATGLMVTLHSAASLVLWPWGWTSTDAPNAPQLQTLGRHMASFNGYTPQQSNDLYPTNGTTDDWTYGQLGIASFTWEMAGQFFQDCNSFENTDVPDNIPALLYSFKSARQPYMDPAGPETLSLVATPAGITPGESVLLTGTANDTRGGEPTQNIAAARYSVDEPSWIADTTYPMTASDGSFNSKVEVIQATIDTTGWASGRHSIFVESQDAAGNWGLTSAAFVYVIDPGVSPVIQGYVRAAGNNLPVAANVTAGIFNTTTDPATGFYSMTVISGTYDMVVEADNFARSTANGVVAQDYQTVEQNFTLYPICSVFTDDVESGNQGWTAQSPWAITTEASHSPTHSWTDSPGGNYGNGRDVSLTSGYFDLSDSTGVTLSFWHTYATEPGYDFGRVEYNTGNGWTQVASYDGTQAGWINEELLIPALDGQASARIRFRFTSDSVTQTADGWHIDDISLNAGGPGCLPPTPPTAEFSSNSPVVRGQPVDFTNLTTGSEPMTYAWDFGDGLGTSDVKDPSYTYAELGTYTVILTSTNNLGTDSISHTVTVDPAPITAIDLSLITPGTIYPGYNVEFSADLAPDTAAKPYDYTIDFGDGTVASGSSSADPYEFSHAYTGAGTYTVQFSAQNAVMPESLSASIDVTVTPTPTAPVADFTSNSPVKLGQPVIFTNLTTGTQPITYAWDFGDGVGTSTLANPTYTYAEVGTYTVTLVATNPGGSSTVTHTVVIIESMYRIFLPLTAK